MVNERADLHLHTTASDGTLSPAAVVRLAHQHGLTTIAITDHDSTEGLPEALAEAARLSSLRIIPGVEMSTDVPNGEIHVLGYFIDYLDPDFQDTLARFRLSRVDRGRRIVEKLRDLGVDISWERVKEFANGGAVGRPHIAQAMLERGYVATFQDAFTHYIGRNGPAYAEREKLTPQEAVALIGSAGGLGVLAHPKDVVDLEAAVAGLAAAGLAGMEVYYTDYPPELVEELRQLAERYGLIPCGGSDFHGMPGHLDKLGDVWAPKESVDRLYALAAARTPSRPERPI